MTGVYLSGDFIYDERNATVRAVCCTVPGICHSVHDGLRGPETRCAATAAAAQSADLSTFYKLAQQAELGDVLNGSSPVTIFAPTNMVSLALPPASLDKLAKDPAQLKALPGHRGGQNFGRQHH